MKKSAYLKLHLRKFLIIFLISYFLLLAIMETNFFWDNLYKVEKKIGYKNTKIIYDFHNNIDLVKKIKSNNLSNFDQLSLSLKKNQLSEIMNQVEEFKSMGYQNDEKKKWFDAELLIGGKEYESKVKLHGTSATWLKRGYLSFKVKQKNAKQYPLKIRRFNLINVQDKYISYSDPLNKLASSFDLISPSGDLKNLQINGTNMGLYYFVEDHKKEFLERNYGIVDYVMFSPLDNWVGTSYGHVSPHDLSYFYYEASGQNDDSSLGIARGQLKLLFSALKNQNYDLVASLVDSEYMARFLALMYLFNDVHLVTGDNLRFVYDFHRGKFYPIFRLENLASKIEIKKNVTFNSNLFENYDYSLTHDFFKYLIQNDQIRFKRDKYLWSLIEDKSEILSLIKMNYSESSNILLASSISRQRYKLFERNLVRNISSNLDFIEQYLSSASLYIINEGSTFYVLDSMVPIRNKQTNLVMNNSVGANLKMKFSKIPSKIRINCKDIEDIEFINDITKKKILSNDIRCIFSSNNSIESNWKSQFDKFEVNYEYDNKKNFLKIKEGAYKVNGDIIFDNGMHVYLNPGVSLLLSSGVSLIVKGEFTSIGLNDKPIQIKSLGAIPFGTIAIHSSGEIKLKNTIVKNGSQAIINGIKYSGQISIHGGKVSISKSKFLNSKGDDGLNIKRSFFDITDSTFSGNFADQIDIDYSKGVIERSSFIPTAKNIDGDGIDLSNSIVILKENIISENGDKGISIGESSNIYLEGNTLNNNNKTIAVKDGSKLFLGENSFLNSKALIYLYKKKGFYNLPRVHIEKNSSNKINFDISNGSIVEVVDDSFKAYQLVN